MTHAKLDIDSASEQQLIDLEWDDLITYSLEDRKRIFDRMMGIYANRKDDVESSGKAELLQSVALLFSIQSKPTEALPYQEQACQVFERVLGSDARFTRDSKQSLANLLVDLERFNEAEQILCHELARSTELLGISHPDTLDMLSDLGMLYSEQGRSVKALRIGKRVHDLCCNHLGNSAYLTLLSTHNLGVRMRALGQKKKALKMLRRNHRACLKFLGETHPLTLLSMNALGYSYLETGRYIQAKRTYERVLEGRLQTLGADHSGTIVTMNNLAHVLLHTGEGECAIDMLDTAYRRSRQTRGSDHSKTRTTLSNLMTYTYIYGTEEETLHLAREVQGLYAEDDDLWQEADRLLAECLQPVE